MICQNLRREGKPRPLPYPNPERHDLNPRLIEARVASDPDVEELLELVPPSDNSGDISEAAKVPVARVSGRSFLSNRGT